MAVKIIYKNHCTPQEQINFSTGNRYYLDSDCGRKLTGVCDSLTTSNGTLTTGVSITTSTQSIVSSSDFVYLKNTGSETIYISLTDDSSSAEYVIALAEGEAFASEISTSARVFVKTASGTSTIEHFSIT